MQLNLLTLLASLYSINFILCNMFCETTTSKAFFWLSVSFMVYHLLPIFLYNFIDLEEYSISSEDLVKPFILSVIGFQSAFIGYYFTKYNQAKVKLKNIWDSNKIIYCLLIVAVFSIFFQNIYPMVLFSRFETVFLILISMILLTKYYRSNRIFIRYKYFAIGAFIISFIFLLTMTTGRRDVIKLIIAFSVIWSMYEKPFSFTKIFIGGLFSFLIVILLALYRTEFSMTHVYERFLLLLSNADYLLLLLSTTLDFLPGHNNYEYIVNNVPNEISYLFGSSLFKILFIFIPRSIWSEKPLGVQELIVEKYQNAFVGGSSQTTTMIGEFHWNFGILGVIIGMYLFGYLCKKIDIQNRLNLNHYWKVIINIVFISWIIELFRGGISTVILVNSFQILFPIILVWLIYKILFMNKSLQRI